MSRKDDIAVLAPVRAKLCNFDERSACAQLARLSARQLRARRAKMPAHGFSTLIEDFFFEGFSVLVVVWAEGQLLPAQTYINVAKRRYPRAKARCEVNSDSNLHNGQRVGEQYVIRYHFQ